MGEDVIANHEEVIAMTVMARRQKHDVSEIAVASGGEPTC
jgi:hypothetical protein